MINKYIVFLVLFYAQFTFAELQKAHVMGYLSVGKADVPEEYNAGFSMYPTVWPILDEHPGKAYQTGLFGTWMGPQNNVKLSGKIGAENEGGIGYIKVEGGLGMWRSTHFPTTSLKFSMGGVARGFKVWANGPGHGKRTPRELGWEKPAGAYGVAQLSPWVVFPLDGLNIKTGESGKAFGYGYLPLPLIDKRKPTAERNYPTGNQSWTLFINSKSFKGPLAFFTPDYWARHMKDFPQVHGKSFDARPSRAKRPVAMETQHISAIKAEDHEGNIYARTVPYKFPINDEGYSIIFQADTAYKKAALWNSVNAWFQGGAVASGVIKQSESYTININSKLRSTWKMKVKGKKYSIDWSAFASGIQLGKDQMSYKWHSEFVRFDYTKKLVYMPEYYKLVKISETKFLWKPVHKKDVPVSTKLTQLVSKDFYTGDNNNTPLETPIKKSDLWDQPGPVAGPYYIDLNDGSRVTYYWYKFCDQPAIKACGFTEVESKELQRRVELIHMHWKHDQQYLPDPNDKNIKLAQLDPAQLVKPPIGMEIGYVPIVTNQKKNE